MAVRFGVSVFSPYTCINANSGRLFSTILGDFSLQSSLIFFQKALLCTTAQTVHFPPQKLNYLTRPDESLFRLSRGLESPDELVRHAKGPVSE